MLAKKRIIIGVFGLVIILCVVCLVLRQQDRCEIIKVDNYNRNKKGEAIPDLSGAYEDYKELMITGKDGFEYEHMMESVVGIDSLTIDLMQYVDSVDYIDYCNIGGEYVVVSECLYKNDNNINNKLWLIDLTENTKELIYEFDDSVNKIHWPKLTDEGVFWVVATGTAGINEGQWELYGWEYEEKEVRRLIGKEGQTMRPCLTSCGQDIVWIEGEYNNDKIEHTVYMLSDINSSPIPLFDINYVSNPYLKLSYTEDIISYADYFNNSWNVIFYELDTENLYAYEVTNLDNWEFLTGARVSKDYIVYTTYFNRLYAVDRKDGNVEHIGASQYYLEGEGDYVIGKNNGDLTLYDIKSRETMILNKDADTNPAIHGTAKNCDNRLYWYVRDDQNEVLECRMLILP